MFSAEEAIIRCHERALQMKREWSPNRRLFNRVPQEEAHAFAVPKMMAQSASFGSQTLNAESLAQRQSSGSRVEMSSGGVEDDDEDEEPLSNQLSVPGQANELETSPAVDSPQIASFTPLPESGAALKDAQHEAQLVENEGRSKDARSDLNHTRLFQHLGSEFEYDFVLGTSPVVAITQLPVLSQPKDQHLNGLPELSQALLVHSPPHQH
ncbi:hypothetical protein FRC01_010980 [Tulasnella sp. 417]|nr:hypothetical protein FRC01_010980 [Tulasnella sp. 417]